MLIIQEGDYSPENKAAIEALINESVSIKEKLWTEPNDHLVEMCVMLTQQCELNQLAVKLDYGLSHQHWDDEFYIQLTDKEYQLFIPKESIEPQAIYLIDGTDLYHCIGCGCHDLKACTDTESGDPCHWLRTDEKTMTGVCSNCSNLIVTWDNGNHQQKAINSTMEKE